jgi:Ca-activated chloride channel family protein
MAVTPGSVILLQPLWLWLIPVLMIVALVWRYFSQVDEDTGFASAAISNKRRFTHPLLHLIPHARASRVSRFIWHIVFWLALAILVLALSQPVRIGEQLPDPPRERDIVFIVDTSLSMVLRDYILNNQRVERISLLKNLLKRFVQTLKGERISIIVFGESANTLVPLTQDQQLLTAMINRISAGMVGRYNALGDAIALAVREAGDVQKRGQILVLFTDAGQHTGSIEPQAAAYLAAEAGLPLYTIAIGATTYAAEEQRQLSGLLYQTVDMTLLQSLAKITHGNSYQAGDSHALDLSIADITSHKENVAEQPVRHVREPLYMWPLALGLLLFTLQQMLRLLRSSSK